MEASMKHSRARQIAIQDERQTHGRRGQGLRKWYLLASSIAWAMSAAFSASHAQPQAYPSKPITLVIPVVAGSSSNDIIGRSVAQRLGPILGQSIIVDNKPGAASTFGGSVVAKAPPDGYTLLLGIGGPIAISPILIPLDYVPIRDLATVALVAKVPYMLVVNTDLPAKNVKELVALAKSRSLDFGSSGNGGTPHLCVELLMNAAGFKAVHIPYKSGAQPVIDLIGGRINMYCAGFAALMPQIKSGKMRAVGTATLTRSELLPELPTFIEQGFPDFEVASWIGINAPGKTPRPVIDRLYDGIAKMMAASDMKAYLQSQGAEPALMSPDDYATYFKSEIAKWTKVIKEGNIKAD